jgi:hypothetical protein
VLEAERKIPMLPPVIDNPVSRPEHTTTSAKLAIAAKSPDTFANGTATTIAITMVMHVAIITSRLDEMLTCWDRIAKLYAPIPANAIGPMESMPTRRGNAMEYVIAT